MSQTDTARVLDAAARLGIDEGAAAGRQDMRRPLQQALDHPPLAVAERGLAEALEDLLDRAAGRGLDLVVGIDEVQPEPLRQAAADRGLARPHQADHDNGPVRPPRARDGVRMQCFPHAVRRVRQSLAGGARFVRVLR